MADRIVKNRLKDLKAANTDITVTACPQCIIHIKNQGESKVMHLINFLKAEMEKQKRE